MSRFSSSLLRLTAALIGSLVLLPACSELRNLPGLSGALEPEDECQTHTDAQEWAAAIACYSKKIAADPKDARNWGWRAYCYESANNHRQAIADATKALQLDPKADWALDTRACAHRNMKDYKKAIIDYSAEIALTPEDADTYVGRGDTYDDMKEFDKALADYNKAVDLDKDKTSSALNNRGWLYLEHRQYDKAIEDFDADLDADESDVVAGYNRAAANFHSGKDDAALAGLKSGPEDDPSENRPYVERRIIFLTKSEPRRALSEFLLAADRSADVDGMMTGRIYAYLTYRLLRRDAEADSILKTALNEAQSNEWPYPILLYLSGKISDKNLYDICCTVDERAECRGIVGFNQQVSGDTTKAHENFAWVKENGAPNDRETFYAERAFKDAKFLTVAK